jgi:hypothetical protein
MQPLDWFPMGMVTGLIFYVGPSLARPIRAPENLMLDDNGALCQTFRQAILKAPEAFTIQIDLAPHPKGHCNFAFCGQAAGVAHWWRNESTEAITAYLPGVDEDDEYIVERALALKPFPISLHLWHEVLKAKRPIYATFLLTPASAEDRVIATAASALANSFFSTLGITENDSRN